jgi:hypothetical protein
MLRITGLFRYGTSNSVITHLVDVQFSRAGENLQGRHEWPGTPTLRDRS